MAKKVERVSEAPQRNIGMELMRATEAAATIAARHLDRGDLDGANAEAAKAMHAVLATIDMDGIIAVGDESDTPLRNGARVGTKHDMKVDVAVDAIEGTPSLSLHRPDALSIAAVADRGGMWNPGPIKYVQTLAVGPALKDRIDLTVDIRTNLKRISAALKCDMSELNVLVLDRPRHAELVKRINACGARVKLHYGGFIAATLLAALPNTNVDVFISTGLAVDAVLAAAAIKALGGSLEIRPDPQSAEEEAAIKGEMGFRTDVILDQDDLVKSSDVFFAATGITEGSLLKGVRFGRDGTQTSSIVLREKTGSVRTISGVLQPEKLAKFSAVDYDGEGG
jgi:fructose-1,6-bisphosphatase II